MNQLIEEAIRQLEQSSGAIIDYFAAMDSILNAFHSQKNSVKRIENDEVDQEITKSELENHEQKHTILEDVGVENDVPEKPSENVDTKEECQIKNDSKPARLSTKVQLKEDQEKLEIEIEFSGYQFKPEHLDVQLVNENTLAISAKDGEHVFKRKFKLASNCQMDKIMPRFKDGKNRQILSITVTKDAKKILNIPISTLQNK